MEKLLATILKDLRILVRDKIGIALMFGMPVLLVIIITSIQNSTFELMNKNKITALVYDHDSGSVSKEFIAAIGRIGMFKLVNDSGNPDERAVISSMHNHDALLTIVIPEGFSVRMEQNAKASAGKALKSFGLDGDHTSLKEAHELPLTLYYQPVLQESLQRSIYGALSAALQLIESKQILRAMYISMNEKNLPVTLEDSLLQQRMSIEEVPVSWNGIKHAPNASQHNVPAWTIFAMFFIVVSLGGSIVREKLSGSFTRLRTLPTSYFVALLSKHLTYLMVTLAQAAVIFSLGIWIFPLIGLPALDWPADIAGLIIVTIICGWCAVSYAICIGVFAQTQEQANGFGAVSIVILAALGGLMVPAFAMPESFKIAMKLSPLHWCLETYYAFFLEGGKLADVWLDIIPILLTSVFLQSLSLAGLKMRKLI